MRTLWAAISRTGRTVLRKRFALLAAPVLVGTVGLPVLLEAYPEPHQLELLFRREVMELAMKYKAEEASFPAVVVKKQGRLLQVEFPVDQRQTDIFGLLVDVFTFFQENDIAVEPLRFGGAPASDGFDSPLIAANDLGTNTKGPVAADPSVVVFRHGNIQTFKINFTEKGGKKGSVTIAGQFKADLPGFRVMVQKEWKASDPFVNLVRRLLEESYKPSEARDARKEFLKFLTVGTSYAETPATPPPPTPGEALKALEELGVEVLMPGNKERFAGKSWDDLGGYERQKRDIEDTILLGLTHGEVYDRIGRGTRAKFERNRPRTVLFEGPPGTGKTTSAKIIASQVNIPLVYVPAEAILSKWFGESEKSMATLFEKCAQLGKAIIFIDEVDVLGSSREADQAHEASRRIVSTLLRKLDSFESENELMLIAATNQKDRLDPALLSRVDLSIRFDLPDAHARREILRRYAKQLPEAELTVLAGVSEGLSGRGILEACRDVERRWASMYIRGEVQAELPTAEVYAQSLQTRIRHRLF